MRASWAFAPERRLELRSEVKRRFGAFLDERVTPHAADRDARGSPLPRELLRDAATIGLLTYSLPKQVGGGGADDYDWGLVLEHVGYFCDDSSLTLLLGLFSAVANTLYETGREDLIERYVAPFVRGERLVSFAYSEGADPFSLRSTVRMGDGECILDGDKHLITGGTLADAFMTYLRDERDDVQVILVERDDPGVEVILQPTMGVRAAGLARLEMHGVRVPPERVIAPVRGLSHVQRFLNRRRVLLSCGPLGRMEAILHACVDSLGDTVRYGRPLTEWPNVQAALGRMFVAVETSRQSVYRALEAMRDGRIDPAWDPVVTVAKYYTTERGLDVAESALRLLGGQAYLQRHPFERYVRDFAGMIAGAGAQDILEVDLGTAVVRAREAYMRGET